MTLTVQQKLVNFKCVLECFVAALEWICNRKTNEDAAIKFPGFDKYVKPHLDNNTMVYGGRGQDRETIQNLISAWENLADEDDDNFVAINVFGKNPKSRATYINWAWTWVNIKAQWYHNDAANTDRIHALYVCHEPGSDAKSDLTMTLDELGLFDGKEPNDNLKRFWDEFKSRYDNYDWEEEPVEEEPVEEVSVDDLADLVRRNKNLILTGAPGTGKTYLAKQVARTIIDNDEYFDEQCNMVQFHPYYDYTDFVEGLRPVTQDNGQIGFKLEPGTFKQFCEQAAAYPDYPYVFIIDEINRGEVSKIFGELFFSLDPDYRGPKGRVKSQYHNLVSKNKDDVFAQGLYVPENVYVIATMNDIDRSVESIDFAFRRRFTWYEVKPEQRLSMLEPANLDVCQNNKNLQEKLDKASFYDCCKNYCNRLNEAICEEPSLGSAYQVGPAYFLKSLNYLNLDEDINENSVYNALEQVWNLHIDPLLREYLRAKSEAELYKIMLKLRNCYYYDNEDDYDKEY